MDKGKQKFFNDYLEVITFFIFILILLVIYIPSTIWQEEDMYKEESRFRMQTVYNVENFYNILTGSYESDGKKAVTLVNAVRDSVMADSTFLGEQIVKLNGEEFLIDVPKGFDVVVIAHPKSSQTGLSGISSDLSSAWSKIREIRL